MNRFIAFIFIAGVCSAMMAQPLETQEVVVAGQSSLRDTLHTQQKQDLDDFWRVAAPDRFAYRYQPPFEPQDAKADSAAHDGLASLDVGTPMQAQIRFAYSDRNNPWVNFWTEAATEQPEDDWSTNRIGLRWAADTRYGDLSANALWSGHKTPNADAEVTWTGFGAGGEWPLRIEPDIVRSLWLRVLGLNLQEETSVADRSFGEMDAVAGAELSVRDIDVEIDVAHLQSSASAQARVMLPFVPVVDDAGVWLAGDSEHLYASIPFRKRISLGSVYPYMAAINIFNNPGIDRVSRAQELRELPTQHLAGTKLQRKRPLDLNVVLEYNSIIPVSAGYRFAWIMDQPVYLCAIDSLYTQASADVMLQEVSFAADYQYSFLRFSNTFIWRQAKLDKNDFPLMTGQLPWLAETENRFSFRADLERWGAGLTARWLGGRRDDMDLAMDDVLLIDLEGEYRLYENLQIRAAISNLIDESYRSYTLTPENGLGFHAGLDYHF